MAGPKLPLYACVGKKHSKSLATARCIWATLFGIIDDLQFLPLCAHILIPKISATACLAVQQGSGSLWRLGHHERAAISDSGGSVVRDGRSRDLGPYLVCCPRFGRHREGRRSANRG